MSGSLNQAYMSGSLNQAYMSGSLNQVYLSGSLNQSLHISLKQILSGSLNQVLCGSLNQTITYLNISIDHLMSLSLSLLQCFLFLISFTKRYYTFL